MKEKLEELRQRALEKIKSIEELDALNELRIAYLGKKGELTQMLKAMKDVSDEERPKIGQMVNETREIIEENLNQIKDKLRKYLLPWVMKW